jgi:hypothetical protein
VIWHHRALGFPNSRAVQVRRERMEYPDSMEEALGRGNGWQSKLLMLKCGHKDSKNFG